MPMGAPRISPARFSGWATSLVLMIIEISARPGAPVALQETTVEVIVEASPPVADPSVKTASPAAPAPPPPAAGKERSKEAWLPKIADEDRAQNGRQSDQTIYGAGTDKSFDGVLANL